jgi:hypothetical protein
MVERGWKIFSDRTLCFPFAFYLLFYPLCILITPSSTLSPVSADFGKEEPLEIYFYKYRLVETNALWASLITFYKLHFSQMPGWNMNPYFNDALQSLVSFFTKYIKLTHNKLQCLSVRLYTSFIFQIIGRCFMIHVVWRVSFIYIIGPIWTYFLLCL